MKFIVNKQKNSNSVTIYDTKSKMLRKKNKKKFNHYSKK